MSSNLLDTGTSLNEGSSPGVLQAQGVDEVTASLEHFSLADTSVRDELAVQNTVQCDIVQESTRNSDSVEVNSLTSSTLESGKQLLTGTHDDRSILREQLKSLECPFTWNLNNISVRDTPDCTISRINEKVEEIEEEAFQWRKFILMLVLCYQHFCRGDTAASLAKQRICEQILDPSEPKGEHESFYHATKNALLHIVNSCKCHLLFETGVLNEARNIFQKVYKFEEMDNPCKATIWGIRAAVLMEYGYEGTKAAVEYSKKAMELDPQQGEWHFLLGKSLGRIRRVESFMEIPAQAEIKALEKAVELTKNPSFIIFLAQAYREVSFRVYSENKHDLAQFQEKLDKMNIRSLELYKEALKLRGNCAHINIRCAQGFSKLKYQYRDMELAKECCAKALALAPNNAMANHVAGSIYERYDRDVERAKRHYQIAGEQGAYGAYMDLFRLKYSEDSRYDPIPEFELLLSRFTEKPRAEDLLIQMGSFYLFIKDDLTTAYRQYWSKVISENPDSERLKKHKCIFVDMKEPVNIYELIFDEARLRLKNKYNGPGSNEDGKLLRQFIVKYSELLPELLQASPKPRRKMALDQGDTYRSRSQRGRGRGRGRSRGRGRGRGRGGGDSNRGNRSQSREGFRGGSHGGNFYGNFRYNRRNSSNESRSSNRGGYHRRGGSRDSSTEGRGGYHRRGGSHDSSTEVRSSNRGGYQRRGGSRDSSAESRSSNRDGYYQRVGSRDSSTESRDGHKSKERHFGSSWQQGRDSSIDGRGTQDKNWRSGPRNFDKIGEQKLNHHRDSSNSSVDSRSDHVRKQDNRYHISRTESLSSTGSTSDVHGAIGSGRIRTESNSSIGSDTRRDWKEGCLGGGPRNKNNNERNWRVDEGRKPQLNLGEMPTNNAGSWRGAEGGREGFQRSVSYERAEGRQHKAHQDSGNRNSSTSYYGGQRGASAASATRASPGEGEGNERKFRRGGIRMKGANFQMSWKNSKN